MRELRTREEISQWITHRLRKEPGCADADVTIQYELQKPEPGGCNWSEDLIVNAGIGDLDEITQRLSPIHLEARRRFNLKKSSEL